MKRMLLAAICIVLHLFLLAPLHAFDLNAFGDVTFGGSSGETSQEDEPPGFILGQLDLWAKVNLDDNGRFKAFFELVVESPGDGFVVDLERIWVSYRSSSRLSVRAGRFHTSLGYWNRTFHHGAFIQTSLFRPRFLEFEDEESGVLPVHIVGGMAVADMKTRLGPLHLELQVGNGASIDNPDPEERGELNPNNVGDVDRPKEIAARIFLNPIFLETLGIGLSFNANRVRQKDLNGSVSNLVDQLIYELDLTYIDPLAQHIEFIFEHYWMVNKAASGLSHTSTFWYVQAGKKFNHFITPYVRYEYFDNLDREDPYFTALHTTAYTESILGVRFDFDIMTGAETAIKLEARDAEEDNRTSRSYWAQWSFGF